MRGTSFPSVNLHKVLIAAQLPALPQSAIRLLQLSRDEANGPAEFAPLIEADPGLTSQVLRFVNSSYFGFSHEIASVKLAITLVGTRTVKNFALWSAVFSLMPNLKCGPFELNSLWRDSLRRGIFARRLGMLLGMKEAEEPFAAALLQDMAIPLLAREEPEAYAALLEARENGQSRLSHLEQKAFGWTHAEAGGIMARQWNLPEQFAVLVESHQVDDPGVYGANGETEKLAVAISALLPATADPIWAQSSDFEDCYGKVCPAGSPSAVELLEQIDREYVEFAPLLKLSTEGKSLVESYNEAAAPTT